jgi:methionine-rich copper-binding protein CopC
MVIKHLLAVFTLAAAASVAQGHARVESSQPKPDSEFQAAPKEIRLQFNETIEPAFSKIELVDPKQAQVKLPRPELDKANPKVMFSPLPALAPGRYQVRWTAMSHDGHKVKGQFAFRVK